MKEATDLGIGASVRRELSGRRLDLSKIKFPVKAGVVTLKGELSFVGVDRTIEEIAVELKFIESGLNMIPGVKALNFELENWSKSEGGVWESTIAGHSSYSGFSSGVRSTNSTDEGLYCDACDMVIRFCPCCGKSLASGSKNVPVRIKRPVPPVRPVVKKNRVPVLPVTSTPKIAVPSLSNNLPSSLPLSSVIPPISNISAIKSADSAVPIYPTGETKVTTPVVPVPSKIRDLEESLIASKPPEVVGLTTKIVRNIEEFKPDTEIVSVENLELHTDKKESLSTAQAKKDTLIKSPLSIDSTEINIAPINEVLDKSLPTFSQVSPVIPVSSKAPEEDQVPLPDFMKSIDLVVDSSLGVLPKIPVETLENVSQEQTSPVYPSVDVFSGLDLKPLDGLDTSLKQDLSEVPETVPKAFSDTDSFLYNNPLTFDKPELNTFESLSPDNELTNLDIDAFDLDDTPLPPMKPKALAPSKSRLAKDPFAALFSGSDLPDMELNLEDGTKDPFSNLDLNLDVLEIFPGNASTSANNSFNLDNIIDLDSPIPDTPIKKVSKSETKTAKDIFDLDDLDLGNFKL